MDQETLKAIVDLVQGVSGDARDVLIAYFAVKIGTTLLSCVTTLSVVALVARTIRKLIEPMTLAKQMQKDLGYSGDLHPTERQHILMVWRKGLATERK